jgi:hypothetical protein
MFIIYTIKGLRHCEDSRFYKEVKKAVELLVSTDSKNSPKEIFGQ